MTQGLGRELDPSIIESTQRLARRMGGEFVLNETEDMAAVGRSLMDAIEANRSHPLLKDWAPIDDPAEILADLLNAYDEKGGSEPSVLELASRVARLERDSHPPIDLSPAIVEILASLGYPQVPSREAALREALEWYRERAETLAGIDLRNAPTTAVAIFAELSLDAGKRARAAIGQGVAK